MANEMGPGQYRAKAVSHKFGRSSTGKEQIYIDFELTAGPHAGRHMPYYGFFTELTADRTLESLEYCGWDGASLRELKGLGSREVELVVENEEREGKTYLRVKWINGTGGGVKDELDAGSLYTLEQRMKGKMLQRQQKRAAGGTGKPMRESGDDFHDRDFGPTDYGDEPPV